MYQGPLYICSDHAGFALKKRLIRYIENELERDIIDLGPTDYDETDDFPDFVIPAALKTVASKGRLIACCGSGAGEVIAANKVTGMRMTIGYSIEAAKLSIEHNSANGLALAGRVLTEDHAMAITKMWLKTTDFLGGKYTRRNQKITDFETNGTIPNSPST